MRTLATRFQLSDVGLKKVCTKHRIPVPGRGYWQRVQAGKQDRRIPLPVIAASPAITFTLRPVDEERPVAPSAPDPAIEAEKSLPPVVVDETTARPHAVTRAMRQELRRQKPDDYGAIRCLEPDALPVRIHPGSTDRLLKIADALLKGFVTRGFELRPGRKGVRFASRLQIVVDREAFEISIEERMRREAHKPTEEEQARRRRGLFVYSRTYDYVPTGELTLKIDPCYGSGLQSSWRDTRHQRIEDRLAEVMVSLRRQAALREAEREKAKRKAARFEQEQQRRGELRARIEAERRAVAKLEQDAENWSRAERIRAFVAAAERRPAGADEAEQPDWVEWARACADRLDPLCENPPLVLDTPDSEMQPIALWQFKDTEGE
jgi:hypothetical protein